MSQARRKTSQKNRKNTTGSRKKSSRASNRQTVAMVDSESTRSILREGAAVLYILAATFIMVSILSHQWWLNLGPMQHLMVERPDSFNLMGPFGHVLATLLTGILGLSSLLIPFWLGVVAYYTWFPEQRDEEIPYGFSLRVLGVAGSFFVAAGFGALVFGPYYGGSVGTSVAEPLAAIFGSLGGALLFGAIFLLFLALATGSSVLRVLAASVERAVSLSLILLRSTLFVFGALLRGVVKVGSLAVGFIRARRERGDQEWEYEEELPRPRRRRATFRDQEELEEEEEYEAGEPDIVRRVMRQSGKGKASRKELTQARKRVLEHARESDSEFYASYEPPALEHLRSGADVQAQEDDTELREKSRQIEQKLADFQIRGRVTHVHPGPVITLYEFEPAAGVKVGRIAALQDDLAMSLRASSIRIIAPIPRRGTVGIEVPNRNYELVRLRDLLESEAFIGDESLLSIPLGKDTYGNPVVEDVAKMPHLLMAGATGTGKSVCINAFLVSLLYRATPAELGLILIDPKILELSIYDGIPHLRVPVVTDPRKAKAVLLWAVNEMERRYRMMQKFGVRSIDGYNRLVRGDSALQPEDEEDLDIVEFQEDEAPSRSEEQADVMVEEDVVIASEQLEPLPKLVIVIDELADLMLSSGREIEDLITRLAQKARASGIHLILATQRPSVDVITGLIKANFPARLSFRVSSRIDSRTILDSMGSEKLLGRGDMLYMRPGGMHLQRIHGAFVSDAEVKRVVEAIKESCAPRYDSEIIEMCEKALQDEGSAFSGESDEEEEYDSFYDRAVELVLDKGTASTSMIQRAFRIGYNRAARIVETMEREGIVGPMDGAKPREVLLRSDEVENG